MPWATSHSQAVLWGHGSGGLILQLGKLREAKRLAQSAGARIPTWGLQFQAQFLFSTGPTRLILSGFSVAGWIHNEPKEPQTPSRALRPPRAPSGTCPELGSKQHWPKSLISLALGKFPRAAATAQGLSIDMFSKIQGLPRLPDPAGMSKGLEAKLADQ